MNMQGKSFLEKAVAGGIIVMLGASIAGGCINIDNRSYDSNITINEHGIDVQPTNILEKEVIIKYVPVYPKCDYGYLPNSHTNRCEPICDFNHRYNPDNNECERIWPICSSGYRYDPNTEDCEPVQSHHNCGYDYYYNSYQDRCVHISKPYPTPISRPTHMCRSGETWSDAELRCIPPDCSTGQIYDRTLGKCVSLCAPGRIYDPSTGACNPIYIPTPHPTPTPAPTAVPTPIPTPIPTIKPHMCRSGETWNQEQYRCIPPDCGPGEKYDTTMKRCVNYSIPFE